MKSRIKFFLSFVLLLTSFSIFGQLSTFIHNDLERKYIIYLPAELPADAPLVFMLHGYGGSANETKSFSNMNAVADENLFAVCYAQGTKDNWDLNFWQVGYDFHADQDVDDVDFLDSLAVYLQNEYNLSSENTFCAGFSNGGDMSYLNACKNTDVFRAVAPVAGCLMQWIHDDCTAPVPIPVFEIHGTDDDVTIWEGDIENNDGWGAYYDVPYTFDFWTTANNCTSYFVDTLPNIDATDGSIVKREKYSNGINNNQVWLYTVIGGGHDWPGAWGTSNLDFNASEEIWSFFENFITPGTTIQTNAIADFNIIPNPAINEVQIHSLTQHIGSNFIIYDYLGRRLMDGNIVSETTIVDITELPQGFYTIALPEFNTSHLFVVVK